MSFNAGPSVEAQHERGYYDFDILCTAVTDGLYDLSGKISILRRLIAKLGTNKETRAVDERLAAETKIATDRFALTGEDVKKLADWDPKKLSATQKFTQQKLAKDFSGVVDEFRMLEREAASKKKDLENRKKANQVAVEEDSERTPLIGGGSNQLYGQQQQLKSDVVDQQEIDFHSGLILEREAEIENIEQGVNEINTIFSDLGALVSQQGQMIDTVEENISNFAQNSENASKQLKKADDYQKRRGKWSCCVLLVLTVVMLVILLAVMS